MQISCGDRALCSEALTQTGFNQTDNFGCNLSESSHSVKPVQAQGTGRSELPLSSFHEKLDPLNSRGLLQIMSRGPFQPKLFPDSNFPPRQASLHFKQRFIPWREMASRLFPSDTGEEDSWKSGKVAGFSTQDSIELLFIRITKFCKWICINDSNFNSFKEKLIDFFRKCFLFTISFPKALENMICKVFLMYGWDSVNYNNLPSNENLANIRPSSLTFNTNLLFQEKSAFPSSYSSVSAFNGPKGD